MSTEIRNRNNSTTPTLDLNSTKSTSSSNDLKEYTLEEVAKHDNKGDCWTAVGDYVYDITKWIDRHPGGWLIMQGAGRDSSVIFETSHPLYVKKQILHKYKIGKLVRPKEDFEYNWDSEFYTVLRSRVEEHFKNKNNNKTKTVNTNTNTNTNTTNTSTWTSSLHNYQDSYELWIQFFQTLFFFGLCYYWGFIQGYILPTIIGSWFFSQIGITIMHDGNHGASSRNPYLSRFMGMFMDFMGASSFIWKHEHNIGHHQFTNSTLDPDSTSGYPFLRYNPSQTWKPHHRYQHIYLWLLYCFVGAKWYVSDVVYVFQKKYRSMNLYPPSTHELFLLFITKSIALVWGFVIPVYFNGFIRGGLILPAISLSLTGYFFALQFVVTHLADDVIFPEEYKMEKDWAKCQVLTTANYSTESKLSEWLSGGLNFQIEHHLFPTISHTHLKEISGIVKTTCGEFGVPYFEHKSYWGALKHHYEHLRRMGKPPSECQGVDFHKLFQDGLVR